MGPVGGHGIGAGDGAQGHGALVGALVTHHAHTLDGQQDDAGLPDLVVEGDLNFAIAHIGGHTGGEHFAGLLAGEFHLPVAQPLDEDVIGILEDAHLVAGDIAENAHSEAGAGEGMAGSYIL